MKREPAFANKLLKKWQLERQQEHHYNKILSARPHLATEEPFSFKFPLLKSKKRMIEEGKVSPFEIL